MLQIKATDSEGIFLCAAIHEGTLNELLSAELKHPIFPADVVHQVSIMVEEAGEALKAANSYSHEGAPIENIRDELLHTGAMVYRCLMHLACIKYPGEMMEKT
jgi:hypothetical protein